MGSSASAQQPVIFDNNEMRLVIRPDLGGRIDQLRDCKTGQDWLWHPSAYDPNRSRSLPVGANFDANWTGGWDEIFPNDAAEEFRGYRLVDHGELWSQAWNVVEHSSLSLKLQLNCQTVPVQVEKTISLDATQPQAHLSYRFQNQSNEIIPFLFKQHAAIAIAPNDEILLPECWVEPAFLEFSQLIGQQQKTRFPYAFAADGREIDLRYTPAPSSKLQEFYYCSDLALGQCGIRRRQTNTALLMTFDSADFPYVWVFQSYGGWQDHYVLVLEPCTTLPYDLEIACRQGTIAQLHPQEIQHRTLTVRLERSNIS